MESQDLRVQLGAVERCPRCRAPFRPAACARRPQHRFAQDRRCDREDPAVSAKVLQVCNSAFFRLPRRVASIPQAVNYLGLYTVRSMVLSAELFQPGKPLSPGSTWRDPATRAQRGGDRAIACRGCSMGRRRISCRTPARCGFSAVGTPVQGSHAAGARGHRRRDAARRRRQKYVGVDTMSPAGICSDYGGCRMRSSKPSEPRRPDSGEPKFIDVLSAVAIAEALLREIDPRDVPVLEAITPMVNEEYLRSMRFPHAWDSLCARATALLRGAEAAWSYGSGIQVCAVR